MQTGIRPVRKAGDRLKKAVVKLAKGTDADMKRTIAAIMVLLMLACMATVSASAPGTSTDPLITLSYLDGKFSESLQTDISQTFGGAADKALGRLDGIYKKYIGYSFAPRFTRLTLASGNTIELTTGSSFILLTGAASLNITAGTVINVSTGTEVPSDSQLTQYQRYFCAEDTTALITATSVSTGQVDGYYLTDGETDKPPLPFIDIPENIWYYAAVLFGYKEGLYSGTSANTFSPNIPMSRGMFVTVLHKLDKLPATGAGGIFSDVQDPSQYYYNAASWANANGIVTGYPDGTFKPNDSITREQMAVTMYRYAAYKGKDMSSTGTVFDTFPDRDQVSDYALDALKWAVTWNVINGSDGRILPRNTATRAEVAQIILNYCEKIGR